MSEYFYTDRHTVLCNKKERKIYDTSRNKKG